MSAFGGYGHSSRRAGVDVRTPPPDEGRFNPILGILSEPPSVKSKTWYRFESSRPHQRLIFRFKIRKLLQHTDIWTARSTKGQYKCHSAWSPHVAPGPAQSRHARSFPRMSARTTRGSMASPRKQS